MVRKHVGLCAICAVIVIGALLTTGCPSQEPEETAVSDVAPEPPSGTELTPEMEAPEQPGEEAAEATAGETDEAPAGEVGEFEYTDTPSVDDIPSGPISGMMHGEPFTAKTVRIEKTDEDTFRMQVSDGELNDPSRITSTITGDDGWRFRFTVPEGSTTTLEWAIDDEKTFDDEHVYYYYKQEGDKPPMSVNGPWGAALEITDWTTGETSDDSRVIGTMTGRLALVMRDQDKSWAAGEFEAPVYEW